MHILFSCSMGGMGHLTPVLDVAAAARELGHDVILLVPPSLGAAARRSGLPVVVGNEPPKALVDDVWGRMRSGSSEPGLIDRAYRSCSLAGPQVGKFG